MSLKTVAQEAKKAKYAMAKANLTKKNHVLKAIHTHLSQSKSSILLANSQDLEQAKKSGLNESMLDRLSLQNHFDGLLADIGTLISLPDPVGETFDEYTLPNGLEIAKMRTPLGVLGVIYESRPNVTLDVSMLAIKSGNCVILRGGSETINTNKELVKAIQQALQENGLPKEAVQLIESPDRALVEKMLKMHEYIDIIIPRGSHALQKFCRENSTIPVITGGIGICHLFVDETAKQDLSLEVIKNAKTRRPTVCNALDTLLVHENIAALFIPQLVNRLKSLHVQFKMDEKSLEILGPGLSACCQRAEKQDWDTEWLSLVLGVKVVKNMEEAIAHIHLHSTQHSDGILTENPLNAIHFTQAVDSAAVYVNASTGFTDGGQFGLGGEVAISTQKLHARGPMGLKELTSYKWVIYGSYQTRSR